MNFCRFKITQIAVGRWQLRNVEEVFVHIGIVAPDIREGDSFIAQTALEILDLFPVPGAHKVVSTRDCLKSCLFWDRYDTLIYYNYTEKKSYVTLI